LTMNEPEPAPTLSVEPETVSVEPETGEEAALYAWFAEQRLKSPDNLEAAARQIITLCSTLLGLLLGLLALTDSPLPAHIRWSGVQWLGGLGAAALALALAAALTVILPRPLTAAHNDPDELQAAFASLLARKSRGVWWAALFFGVGMVCLTAVTIIALILIS
jgi:hypothetical protein